MIPAQADPYKFYINLGASIKSIASLCIIWLALILVFRVLEIGYAGANSGISENFFALVSMGWLLDLLMWLKYVWLVFLIFIPVYILSPDKEKLVLKSTIILFFIIQLALISYFKTALVPLGADIFGYSLSDIKQTIGASGGLSITIAIGFLVVVSFLIYVLFFVAGKLKFNRFICIVLPLFSAMLVVSGLSRVNQNFNLNTEFANNLVLNKSDHFYSESFAHFFPDNTDDALFSNSASNKFGLSNTKFNYVDPTNYPFLHRDTAMDVLSPFFNSGSVKPNIVIILVEGLGRAFTNEGAYLGNFTPFIDSLSRKSLYWKNFLSQGGRTFAVLPSMLGSLPFAKNGFSELGQKMPPQLSLLNIFQYNGYNTSFYYGGDATFDNMAQYLKTNNIDQIRDENTFPSGYQKLPSSNGFTWGYNDKELYRYFLSTRQDVQQPQLSVILTVSSHNPFMINEADKYQKAFENRLTYLKFTENQKNIYRNYKNQYASILYTDDALRTFFDNYKKRPDFNNTIFLISGDHRMPEIPMSTKIDRYHVPFIIYSPKLKTARAMASVSTHFDIAPSLLAYMKSNYNIKLPSINSWIGQGLDTTIGFRNIHSLPMIQNKTDIIDFIMGGYHLNGDNLFKLNAELGEDLVDDNNVKNELKSAFSDFKKRNNFISNGGKIIPDSLFKNYSLKN